MSLSVLVVDDEDWIRLGIVSKLNKSNLQFSFIKDVASGAEALRISKRFSFNILICDIRLGDMSGLDLCSALLDEQPNLKMIIISGYNDFAYAQKAITLGVTDYLLKPVLTEDLISALRKCIVSIQKQQNVIHQENLLQAINQSKQLQKFLMKRNLQEIELGDALFPNRLNDDLFAAIYLYLDDNINVSISSICEWILLEKRLNYSSNNFLYCEANPGEFIFYLCLSDDQLKESVLWLLNSLIQMIRQDIDEVSIGQYTFGISNVCDKLSVAHAQAIQNMKHRIFCEEKNIIYTQNIQPHLNTGANTEIAVLDFRHAIQQKNLDKIFDLLHSFYTSLDMDHVSYDYLQTFYWHMKIFFASLDTKDLNLQYFPEEIYIFTSVWEFIDFLKEAFRHGIRTSDNLFCNDPQTDIVKDLCCYIEQNYACSLSLREFAEQRYISYCYLSLLFKETMGVTFQEYVISVRLKQACQLLRFSTNKIKDVAVSTGFHDQHYFSKVFKKKMGCTPREYQVNFDSESS